MRFCTLPTLHTLTKVEYSPWQSLASSLLHCTLSRAACSSSLLHSEGTNLREWALVSCVRAIILVERRNGKPVRGMQTHSAEWWKTIQGERSSDSLLIINNNQLPIALAALHKETLRHHRKLEEGPKMYLQQCPPGRLDIGLKEILYITPTMSRPWRCWPLRFDSITFSL
jgi:hypothetical protein